MKRKHVGILLAAAMTLGACGSSTTGSAQQGALDTSTAKGTVNYWLWDDNQKPAYQKCATDFMKANPGIDIKITQYSWDDYWNSLNNAMASGTAPDVFTNHLTMYPQYVSQQQLQPLDDTLAADHFDTDQYQPGLASLWVGQDGLRYGLPKDFDTIALYYNKQLLADAGVSADQLAALTWNPDDGGTYEKMMAHLTIDANGKRGDEQGFDKAKVKVYGLGLDGYSGGALGQAQWSMYTATQGWTVTDKNPWGTHYNYDKPEFQKTIAWMQGMMSKGYMPPLEAITGQTTMDLFAAGKYATVMNGSWVINQAYSYKGLQVGIAPTPLGPNGKRASMYNGLADSVWAGSQNKAAAIKWVEYLGSAACQDVIGKASVVFPAIPHATDLAKDAFASKGIDVKNFLIHLENKTGFLPQVTEHGPEINGIMNPAVDAVVTGQKPASSLTQANEEVNALFN
ncbi:MAG: sugar ABC transporter substrate-binding protein [Actinomycetaceae bacterium]|nr:sugar ABC transporter substrate-binding protein [Actinomycetaceae bacterium]MDY6082506.1 sugar ABC transporter substrate-binding protein [Actinomycetaceae bacterium]